MPSPQVIDHTLSDDEIQPDPIRSDQQTSMPTQATNRFRTSSSTPPTSGINRTRRILPVIQGTFAAIEQAESYLPLQPFFNTTHFGQTLINCIHNQHRIGIPDEYFVETCINTYTQNGFVTKEFVKIDEDSQTQNYTIIYIKFQGQTPPFSTHNRDIFERLLPTPFPQNFDLWHTSGCLMADVPCLDHLWDGQKDCLDVGQVRCFHEETSRKLLFWKGDTKESDRIPTTKSLV